MKRLIMTAALSAAAVGCGLFEEAAVEPLRCKLVSPATVSYQNPQISVALSDADRSLRVFATSLQAAVAPVSDPAAAPQY